MAAATGFPASTPFIIAIDYGTPSEEVALVTAVAGLSFTVTRGYDGTSATSHNTGAPVRHTWTAMDGNDSRAHEGSAVGVHGISGLSSVVGTLDVQTLTNKTLTAPAISGGSISGSVTGNPTFTAGVKGGSTGQFTVDSSGKVASSTMVSAYAEDTPAFVTSSTTYVDGSPAQSITCIVPPSGKVQVSGRTSMFNNTSSQSLYSTINVVGSVSGTLRASTDAHALRLANGTTQDITPGYDSFIITSANIGETLTIKWQFHVTGASTAQIDYRSLSAVPLLG